ncbi:hypothetical protein BaRGS_00004664, partial [Batillaria attramentaria]
MTLAPFLQTDDSEAGKFASGMKPTVLRYNTADNTHQACYLTPGCGLRNSSNNHSMSISVPVYTLPSLVQRNLSRQPSSEGEALSNRRAVTGAA